MIVLKELIVLYLKSSFNLLDDKLGFIFTIDPSHLVPLDKANLIIRASYSVFPTNDYLLLIFKSNFRLSILIEGYFS